MRLLRPLLLPLLLAAPLLAACTSGDDAPAHEAFPRPPASAFTGGPCELVADDVVSLGRATYELKGVAAPAPAARDALRAAQDRVSALAETAPAPAGPALQRLVVRTGLVRIQADAGQLKPAVLSDLRAAYTGAVSACSSSAGSAQPSAG